jgi:hypothetical protein
MKQSKKDRLTYKETRWHLLRVEKNGQLKPFVHLRGLAIALAALICVMAGVIGWLSFEWMDTRRRLVTIQESISRQNQDVEAVRQERDAALARLGITESKLKSVLSGPPLEKQNELLAIKAKEPALDVKATPSANDSKAPTAKAPKQTPQAPEVSTGPENNDMDAPVENVIADNLFVCASPNDTSLNIEFKVINMGARKEPVSGHAFIILKDAHAEQDQWLVVPGAMLMDARPVQSRGQRFRIYNFRTIKFKVLHENPVVFVQATIFIFNNSNELIFERDYTLDPIRVCS